MKDRNEVEISEKRENLGDLDSEMDEKRETLKAQKRQNKLMTVALKKAE